MTDTPPRSATALERMIGRLRWMVTLVALALMLLATASLTTITYQGMDRQLDKSLDIKGRLLADILTAKIERATRHAVPLERIPDLDTLLENTRGDHAELLYLGLFAEGTSLASSGATDRETVALVREEADRLLAGGDPRRISHLSTDLLSIILQPVSDGRAPVAVLVVGTDEFFAWRKVKDNFFDILTVLLVSLIVAFEIVVLLLVRPLVGPLRELVRLREGQGTQAPPTRLLYRSRDVIGQAIAHFNAAAEQTARQSGRKLRSLHATSALDARLPLFLFIFADEMQKPFLPLYAQSLTPARSWITPEVLISLPIAVFMLVIAIATLWAGPLVDRLGPRRTLLASAVPAVAGYLITAFAPDIWALLVGRGTTGLGYAGITIAAQGYIASTGRATERAQSMSVFVSALMAASICGAATGGILASELGYRSVFLLSIALTLASALAGWRLLAMPAALAGQPAKTASLSLRSFGPILRNRAFLSVLLFATIPSKVVLTGFVTFAIPLYLSHYGATAAETGRIILIYPVLIMFLGPWFSRLADYGDNARACTFAGTLLSGMAVMLLAFWSSATAAAAAVALLGLAHAVSTSPQISLATHACRREIENFGQTRVLGLLRTCERLGSVGGAILMGSLIAWQGLGPAMGIMGFGAIVAACGLLVTSRRRRTGSPG